MGDLQLMAGFIVDTPVWVDEGQWEQQKLRLVWLNKVREDVDKLIEKIKNRPRRARLQTLYFW